MLFKMVVFNLALFVVFTQNMPHALSVFAVKIPEFSLFITVSKWTDDDEADEINPTKPPT